MGPGGLDSVFYLQRIREDMTLRFQKQEVGSWKLEVGFSQLRSLERKRLVDLGTAKDYRYKVG